MRQSHRRGGFGSECYKRPPIPSDRAFRGAAAAGNGDARPRSRAGAQSLSGDESESLAKAIRLQIALVQPGPGVVESVALVDEGRPPASIGSSVGRYGARGASGGQARRVPASRLDMWRALPGKADEGHICGTARGRRVWGYTLERKARRYRLQQQSPMKVAPDIRCSATY
jgi:hypothetical protein